MSKPPVPKVKPKDSPLSPVNSDPSRYEIDQMLVRHEQKEVVWEQYVKAWKDVVGVEDGHVARDTTEVQRV